MPVLLTVDVNRYEVESGISISIRHHDYCQPDTHAVIGRNVLCAAVLPGLREHGDVFTGNPQTGIVLRDGDNILCGIRGVLHLEVKFDSLSFTGCFRCKRPVVYHRRAAGKDFKSLDAVIISCPAVIAPVDVIPRHRDGRLVHFVNNAVTVAL